MLERNLAIVRYQEYDIFVGVYPNDVATLRVVTEAADNDPRVHLSLSPHAGPTSKGDCLNSIYRQMENYELAHGVRFEVVVTHDAEDLLHPESLRLINWFSRRYQMVQIPVLPLPTGAAEFTHGVYCDEFAEYQTKDIPVRQRLGGFLPSNGVGVGFCREALDQLARQHGDLAFDPEALTEDYQTGYLLHALGYAQIFVPLQFDSSAPVATREYFPRRFAAALRQRSRWMAGIALQGWQRHGWRSAWRQRYWLWRDRKGLVGNLLTPLANLYLANGLANYLAGRSPGGIPQWMGICATGITVFHMAARTIFTARIYGWRFASFASLRILWGNLINFLATALAIGQFLKAASRRRSMAWNKTEHVFPISAKPAHGRPRIGEVLVRMRCVSLAEMQEALETQPPGMRLGDYLMSRQRISEEELYRALSSHAGIPLGVPATRDVSRPATRALPLATTRRWKVLPYRVAAGELHVLTAEVPSEEMTRDLSRTCHLEVRFRLVRPRELEALSRKYLPGAVA
jgi:adsorption protein B